MQKAKELTMTVEGQRNGSLDTGSTPVYSTQRKSYKHWVYRAFSLFSDWSESV